MDSVEVDKLLDALDEQNGNKRDVDKRDHERHNYRNQNCVVHISQPGSATPISYSCPTRNLSAGGISFLHGGFVHVGSEVRVQLISTFGAWQDASGTVVGCSLIRAPIHEVNVRFAELIEPSHYCRNAIKSPILLVDDDPSIIRLAELMLGRLNCTVDTAENGRIGVEKAMQAAYDVVFMDLEMPVMDGMAAVAELRTKGYTGAVVAATAMTRPEDRERCLRSGFNFFIGKPYTKDDLSKILDTAKKEPLLSTLANDPEMFDLITAFVESMPASIRSIEEDAGKELLGDLEATARNLKGTATGHGFEPISDAARKVESGVQAGLKLAAIKPLVGELVELCQLTRAPQRSESAGEE